MKKFLSCLLLLLLIPLFSLADTPPGIWGETFTPQELLPLMNAAMAKEMPDAVICTGTDGMPIAVYEYGSGFCIAQRKDGLRMLCCFYAVGNSLHLDWHNDLLLSSAQALSMSVAGPEWGPAPLPGLTLAHDRVTLWLDLWNGSRLRLLSEYGDTGWRVTEIAICHPDDSGRMISVLTLPDDCLSDDILLSSCHPGNWLDTPGDWP